MLKFAFEVAQNEQGTRLDKFLVQKFLEEKIRNQKTPGQKTSGQQPQNQKFQDQKPGNQKSEDQKFLELPLQEKTEITRSKIQNLIARKQVLNQENEPFKSASQKTKFGQKIFVLISDPQPPYLEAKEIFFEIIFEDEDLLVINKPSGLTVHPGAGNQNHTLVNALLFTHQNRLAANGDKMRPGIVHRLDKDTSGLMLVAKNDFTHQALSLQLKERSLKRNYLAFIYGCLTPPRGVINKNITRSRFNRLKMRVSQNLGRQAITHYKTREIFAGGFAALLECSLETGRTHQIRVHLEAMKHSLIGDQIYNSCKKILPPDFAPEAANFIKYFPRQALQAYKISFLHPRCQKEAAKEMTFEIELAADLKKLQNFLKNT
jgi:23S rRNA pseudouridine1911/1915/1917 synthase